MLDRIQEYKTLLLRISIAYLFYFIARVLFYIYNDHIIIVESFEEKPNYTYFSNGGIYLLKFKLQALLKDFEYANGLFTLSNTHASQANSL